MADETPPKKNKKLLKKTGGEGHAARDSEELEETGGGKRKLLIFAGIAVLMLGMASGIGFFVGGMMTGDVDVAGGADVQEAQKTAPEKKEKRHNIYVTVGKLLAAVEYKGATRYIQAEVDLVGYEKEVMEDAQHNVPALRNRLLLLFSSQDFEEVRTIAGRERLRLQSLKAVNDVLDLDSRGDRVEDVYFTAFVIQ